MAPLKREPKGPMTGNGELNATKMEKYHQRLRQQQKDRLKNLKKKENKKGSLRSEEKEEISMLEKELCKACGQCGKKK